MSDFITPAMTAIVQVTLATLVLGGLILVIGRRRPAITAWMSAATLVIAAGLTVVAFAPTPGDWTWARSTMEATTSNTPVPSAATRGTPFHGWDMRSLLAQLRPTTDTISDPEWSWRTVLVIVAGIGSALSLFHWLVGVVMIVALTASQSSDL